MIASVTPIALVIGIAIIIIITFITSTKEVMSTDINIVFEKEGTFSVLCMEFCIRGVSCSSVVADPRNLQRGILPPDPDDPLDANEEYRSVLKLALGDFSLVYSPEVDCADPEEFEEDYQDLRAFVTVKSCKEITDERKMRNFRKFKLCDWWVENQLSGVPRIIVGYRNDDGIVHTLELLKTEELPEKGEVSFHFLC
ncbi:decapping and exoribonuclease protein-like [Penaeus vannamei]|uniref:decapping and exoribonuclease protein-like n=1 Tax=Penaeus vannamei TaxID=6689 RepID=UPI00387F7510